MKTTIIIDYRDNLDVNEWMIMNKILSDEITNLDDHPWIQKLADDIMAGKKIKAKPSLTVTFNPKIANTVILKYIFNILTSYNIIEYVSTGGSFNVFDNIFNSDRFDLPNITCNLNGDFSTINHNYTYEWVYKMFIDDIPLEFVNQYYEMNDPHHILLWALFRNDNKLFSKFYSHVKFDPLLLINKIELPEKKFYNDFYYKKNLKPGRLSYDYIKYRIKCSFGNDELMEILNKIIITDDADDIVDLLWQYYEKSYNDKLIVEYVPLIFDDLNMANKIIWSQRLFKFNNNIIVASQSPCLIESECLINMLKQEVFPKIHDYLINDGCNFSKCGIMFIKKILSDYPEHTMKIASSIVLYSSYEKIRELHEIVDITDVVTKLNFS